MLKIEKEREIKKKWCRKCHSDWDIHWGRCARCGCGNTTDEVPWVNKKGKQNE